MSVRQKGPTKRRRRASSRAAGTTKRRKKRYGNKCHLANPGIKTEEEVAAFLSGVHGVVINNMVGSANLNIACQDPRIPLGTEPIELLLRRAALATGGFFNRFGFGLSLTMRFRNAVAIVVNRNRINLPGCRSEAEVLFLMQIVANRLSNALGIAFDVHGTWITNRHGVCYTGRSLDTQSISRWLSSPETSVIGLLPYNLQVGDNKEDVLSVLIHPSGPVVACGTPNLQVIHDGIAELLPFLAHFSGEKRLPQNPKVFTDAFGDTGIATAAPECTDS